MSNNRFFGTGNFDGDIRNVLILSPYLQTKENARADEIDFTHSLVVDLDSLSNDIAEQLTSMAVNPVALQNALLIEYLAGKSFRNSDRVLHWLQSTGSIVKLPVGNVFLTKALGGHSLEHINTIIRKEKLDKESGHPTDVDAYRKEQAREYQKQLEESQYPDFGNPSDNGVVEPTPIPEDVPLPLDAQVDIPVAAPATSPLPVSEAQAIDTNGLHSSIVDEIRANQVRVDEAVQVMKSFEDVLASSTIDRMVNTLKSYGQRSEEGVRDELIDLLAKHYEFVDGEYIKRNLDAAEKRLSKKSKGD